MDHWQSWVLGAGLALGLPLFWKLLPTIGRRIIGPFNESAKAILRNTKSLWKGHAQELEKDITKLEEELKKDIEEVDKEP